MCFWRVSISLTLIALAAPPLVLADPDFSDVEVQTIDLGNGLYVLVDAGGNIGLSVGDDGAFLVDDQYSPLTERIQRTVAAVN